MEMRKFIVEIHPDGRVTAVEYDPPEHTPEWLQQERARWLKAGYKMGWDDAFHEFDNI